MKFQLQMMLGVIQNKKIVPMVVTSNAIDIGVTSNMFSAFQAAEEQLDDALIELMTGLYDLKKRPEYKSIVDTKDEIQDQQEALLRIHQKISGTEACLKSITRIEDKDKKETTVTIKYTE